MKKNIFITALLFMISFFVFSQNNTMKIKIDGMKCQAGCAMFIESELNKMRGVVEASIDFSDSTGEVVMKKRISESSVLGRINKLKGGSYQATIINDATNQLMLKQGSKTCSKGKSCCQMTGKKVASCDNKSKGCCSGGTKKIVKKDNSIANMSPGHTGCQKACCAKK
tara:strand:- start:1082 stop:1585 length:504 start_codon:yes stop_codon:yes gene_type:complete